MEYKVPFLPDSKRFFRISELAGKRWPNITESQIYEWHDMNFRVPVKLEMGGSTLKMVDTTWLHLWKDPMHGGQVNMMAYWMFFPEFTAFSDSPDEEMSKLLEPLVDKCPEFFKARFLTNAYLMPDTESTAGFAFNKAGKVNCIMFFDERGIPRIPAKMENKEVGWCPMTIEVCKEDLLIRASSVQLLEAIAPEITSPDYQAKFGDSLNAAMEEAVKHSAEKEDSFPLAPGSNILEGWKDIANYVGCSASTAKRRFKSVVRHNEHVRKVITTTAEIDEFRLTSSKKKRK